MNGGGNGGKGLDGDAKGQEISMRIGESYRGSGYLEQMISVEMGQERIVTIGQAENWGKGGRYECWGKEKERLDTRWGGKEVK